MFHLAAFTTLLGVTANTDVPALTDDFLVITNNHFLLTEDYDVIFAYVSSATLSRARLSLPAWIQYGRHYVRPIELATLPTDLPSVEDLRANPIRLPRENELSLEATSAIAMGTERFTGLIGLTRDQRPAPRGDIMTLRGTSVAAAVANAWTSVAVTWEQTLPGGIYAVVGFVTQSTNGIASRLIFENQKERPGSISIGVLGNETDPMFLGGRLGEWGRFRSYVMPIVQVLANAADAAHECYLQLIRIG